MYRQMNGQNYGVRVMTSVCLAVIQDILTLHSVENHYGYFYLFFSTFV